MRDLHSMLGRGARTRIFRVRVRVRVMFRVRVMYTPYGMHVSVGYRSPWLIRGSYASSAF